MRHIDVAHAALMEAGRPDLAEIIIGFDDEDERGFYLEVIDDDGLTEADWKLIGRAEDQARAFIKLVAAIGDIR